MAVKKAVAKRKKKAVARTKTKVGDSYACEVCGLSVVVDDVCGCVDACDIVCCETPMKRKRAKK